MLKVKTTRCGQEGVDILISIAMAICFILFQRGHTVRAVCESFQLSKDAGFKVIAHMMPDLPNVGLERDIQQFIVSIIAGLVCNHPFSMW